MPLGEGSVFADYTVIRLLGTGGMGEVYLVQHPRIPRREALKVLHADVSADPEFRARFNREADIAATLWHPHIVGIHDRGEFEGKLWISMDYVEGDDAGRVLGESFPTGMPEAQVAAIVTSVAAALDYAHAQGMLHRDVKPSNVLITNADDDLRRILLADFGIARQVNEVSGLTATNMTVGSVHYASPEQLMGETMDGRSDQYALAATAFHLLTGAPPFPHTNPAVVISHHLNSAPPKLANHRTELAPFDDVIGVAMAKIPSERFAHCQDFARALSQRVPALTATGQPTQAAVPIPMRAIDPPNIPAAHPAQHAKRRSVSPHMRRIVGAIAALIVVAVAVTIFVEHRPSRDNAAPSVKSPATSDSVDAAAPTPLPPPTVAPADLGYLLLRPPTVEALMGTPGLRIAKSYSTMSNPLDAAEGDLQMTSYSPESCLGAGFNTVEPAYHGSGYTGTQGIELDDADDSHKHWIDEGVVAFPTIADAKRFFSSSQDSWRQCSGKTLSVTYAQHGTNVWTLGDVQAADGTITIHKTIANLATNWACTHVMGTRSNIIVDAFACGYGSITDQPVAIVQAIMERAPA